MSTAMLGLGGGACVGTRVRFMLDAWPRKDSGQLTHPALVVVPASLLANWRPGMRPMQFRNVP